LQILAEFFADRYNAVLFQNNAFVSVLKHYFAVPFSAHL